jgi:hypothetical protein
MKSKYKKVVFLIIVFVLGLVASKVLIQWCNVDVLKFLPLPNVVVAMNNKSYIYTGLSCLEYYVLADWILCIGYCYVSEHFSWVQFIHKQQFVPSYPYIPTDMVHTFLLT